MRGGGFISGSKGLRREDSGGGGGGGGDETEAEVEVRRLVLEGKVKFSFILLLRRSTSADSGSIVICEEGLM